VTGAAPTLVELVVGGEPGPWEELGFRVRDGACRIGTTTLRFDPAADGDIRAWALAGDGQGDVDGLPTRWTPPPPAVDGGWAHPIGATKLDHVVVTTPDLERTTAGLEAVGLRCRRVRETEAGPAGRPLRQAFFRLGEVILEVVGPPSAAGDGPSAFWGLVAVVEDLDACAARLGGSLGSVRDAVQPGRRIATVRASAGVPVALAIMST
jgi:hypothetical protein